MALIWDTFLEDYEYEIFFKWNLRDTLEIFWYYCQDGGKSIVEVIAEKAKEREEWLEANKRRERREMRK